MALSLGVPWILRVELAKKKKKKTGARIFCYCPTFFLIRGWGEFGVNSGFEGCKFHSTGKKKSVLVFFNL